MRILCIIPPYIPSYFNAGHHLPVFSVAAYLREHLPESKIDCFDCAALNITWKEICDLLVNQYDVIALMNDFDGVDSFERFMYYKNGFSPNTKVIAFGRMSKQIPKFFFQFGVNAVLHHGDFESGVLSYINYLKGFNEKPSGVYLTREDSFSPGEFLAAEDWILPDVTDIPYEHYGFMYKNDMNKFCGIPQRQELVIPVARGCPVGCAYCDVPPMQGKIERRLSVEKTIEYIKKSFEYLPFEYVSFYAPTFTLNPRWVKEFCRKMIEAKMNIPWKCVTVLKTLNDDLLKLMGEAGCVRISLGVESFTNSAALGLPKVKQDTLESFKHISSQCKKHDIELNCFIMLGLPGDTPEDVKYTIETCLKHGARVRPTIYTAYEKMHDDMSVNDVMQFNRQLFQQDLLPENIANEYYKIFYANKMDMKTNVMNNPKFNKTEAKLDELT